jgi:hypothetical protein
VTHRATALMILRVSHCSSHCGCFARWFLTALPISAKSGIMRILSPQRQVTIGMLEKLSAALWSLAFMLGRLVFRCALLILAPFKQSKAHWKCLAFGGDYLIKNCSRHATVTAIISIFETSLICDLRVFVVGDLRKRLGRAQVPSAYIQHGCWFLCGYLSFANHSSNSTYNKKCNLHGTLSS